MCTSETYRVKVNIVSLGCRDVDRPRGELVVGITKLDVRSGQAYIREGWIR